MNEHSNEHRLVIDPVPKCSSGMADDARTAMVLIISNSATAVCETWGVTG